MGLYFLDDLLEPFFKITSVPGSGKQTAHIKRKYRCIEQDFRDIAFDDLACQAFCNRRFTNARIADIEGIIL